MATYIIQSSDNQQFTLTTDQINKYPFLKDIILDIEVEPGSITDIPFPSDLLTIVFNNDYNQPLGLDKLVILTNLVAHLGLENEVHKLLWTLASYFQQKFTAPHVALIKNIMNKLQIFLVRLFFDKIITVSYNSTFDLPPDMEGGAKYGHVHLTSANLDHVMSTSGKSTVWMFEPIYSLWNKNRDIMRNLEDVSIEGVDIGYISNDGKPYYVKPVYEQDDNIQTLVAYKISPTPYFESPALHHDTIPMPNYTRTTTVLGFKLSIDLSKYIYSIYDSNAKKGRKNKIFVGSVTDPRQVVSFDIGDVDYSSSLFDTIVSINDDDTSYIIYNIQYPQIISSTMKFPEIKIPESSVEFYLSYDGKTIAEVIDNNVRVFNHRGQLLANKAMSYDENILAVTNNMLITYHDIAEKLHIWLLASLSTATGPTLRLTPSSDYSTTVNYVINEEVILGEDNTFLFLANTSHSTTAVDKVKSLEWTKYSIGYKGDMNQFLDSLQK